MDRRHAPGVAPTALVAAVVLLAGCRGDAGSPATAGTVDPPAPAVASEESGAPTGVVTLAFAGDTHFQLNLAALLEHPRGALGPVARTLADADLAMVNLESAITERGTAEAKEREVRDERFHYRTSPAALDVLAAAGIDVVTMANNHGADYGPVGLRDTLAAIRTGPVPVVGIGRDRRAAFAPYRTSIRGTRLAVLAADGSFREGASGVWAAGARHPGIADAHADRPRALLAAVAAAAHRADVVVVYLHWGVEGRACPTRRQRVTARALADAGADVVVGTHAHVQLGSGWLGDTYVNYGLGNFLWYHDHEPATGVLRVRIRDGTVVGDAWVPARIGTYGIPSPVRGRARQAAVTGWRRLRACTGLADRPPARPPPSRGRSRTHSPGA